MNAGSVIAVSAWAGFIAWIFARFIGDVARWFEHRSESLASECVSGAVVTDDDLVIAELDWQFEHGACAPDPRRRLA